MYGTGFIICLVLQSVSHCQKTMQREGFRHRFHGSDYEEYPLLRYDVV
jgi:hypothetical protein